MIESSDQLDSKTKQNSPLSLISSDKSVEQPEEIGKSTSKEYKLTEADVDRIDSIDMNPLRRAKRIQSILSDSDPYDVLCFCINTLPSLIVNAPPFVHAIVKSLAAYVYRYHYFIRNEGK